MHGFGETVLPGVPGVCAARCRHGVSRGHGPWPVRCADRPFTDRLVDGYLRGLSR